MYEYVRVYEYVPLTLAQQTRRIALDIQLSKPYFTNVIVQSVNKPFSYSLNSIFNSKKQKDNQVTSPISLFGESIILSGASLYVFSARYIRKG